MGLSPSPIPEPHTRVPALSLTPSPSHSPEPHPQAPISSHIPTSLQHPELCSLSEPLTSHPGASVVNNECNSKEDEKPIALLRSQTPLAKADKVPGCTQLSHSHSLRSRDTFSNGTNVPRPCPQCHHHHLYRGIGWGWDGTERAQFCLCSSNGKGMAMP